MTTYATALRNDKTIQMGEDSAPNVIVRAEASDAQLIELIVTGDDAAFECLFERYRRLVAAVAARYFRNAEQVDEVIQISFAKAYFEFKHFRGGHDFSLASWLGKITANACRDLIRNQKHKPENFVCEMSDTDKSDLIAAPAHDSAEDRVVNRDLAEKLLSRLKPDDRTVMEMLYLEDMSLIETAGIMGWSLSKTKVRAWRARHALRSILRKIL